MKSSYKTLIVAAAVALFGSFAQAQNTPRIAIVDMAKIYDGHYKTEENKNKLMADEKKVQEEFDKLNAQGNAMVEEYKELSESIKNPALSADAKAKAEADAQAKLADIQKKQQEVNAFRQNAQRQLQQRINNFKQFLLEEITGIATNIAKKKGANMLIDKSGPTAFGIPAVIYVDDSFDITADVIAEINKDRPAETTVAPAAAATSAAPAAEPAASGETPTVKFPGSKN